MGIFQRLFQRQVEATVKEGASVRSEESKDLEWEPLPSFIAVHDAKEIERVSVIASAIAAGNYPDSTFRVKTILQRNPEVKLISLLAASIAVGQAENSQLAMKHIYKKKTV